MNTVNFSIGAASEDFYKKVRGGKLPKVLENIHGFLELRKSSDWKPTVIVQINDLPDLSEMKNEIAEFRKYWSNYGVNIAVWDKFNWGVMDSRKIDIKRYPCYSLWKYLFVNADNSISVCCMDWRHGLLVGSAESQTLQEVWRSPQLKNLRRIHIEKSEDSIQNCMNCNCWSHEPKTINYHT